MSNEACNYCVIEMAIFSACMLRHISTTDIGSSTITGRKKSYVSSPRICCRLEMHGHG